jgi:2-iminobutanoate/2-iminopropanoate deaminase
MDTILNSETAPAGRPRREVIKPATGHKVRAAVSHCVRVDNMLYLSGTPGYTGERQLASDFKSQFTQAMENVRIILAESGAAFDDVARVLVYLVNQEDFWTMDELYRQYFAAENFPARTTIVTQLAIPGMLVEVEVTAVCPN